MKILVTSSDALINNKTSSFFEGVIEALDYFISMNQEHAITVISAQEDPSDKIPKRFNPLQVGKKQRAGKLLIEQIKETFECDTKDIIVLGSKDLDMRLAANSKLLLLRATYAINNNPTETIYTKPYGLNISSGERLQLFFKQFLSINKPWYYELHINATTSIYSLTNANTYHASRDETILNEYFASCLKDGDDSYKEIFLSYILVCSYFIKELETVNYFATYPSSSIKENEDMLYFKDAIRKSFGNKSTYQLLLRHKAAVKRHKKGKGVRIEDGCNSQYDTIHLNPYYKGKLKGKTICIIDDFTTYGTSCETVRHILEAEGVSRILFITFGKFGKEYHSYKYYFKGDVYTPEYTFNRDEIITQLTGTFNAGANRNFVDSLRDLI